MLDFLQAPTKFIAPSIVIIFLFFLTRGFYKRYYVPAKKLASELGKYTADIKAIRNNAPAERRIAAKRVFNDTAFFHQWSEFEETLHDQHEVIDGERIVRKSRATTPASYYFSTQSVVDTPLHAEYFKHLPGILTGLGIIGTFFGLMLGLNAFDPSAPEKVQESVSGLIRDVFYAFIGSLASIVCAMFVTHLEKEQLRICYDQLEKLTDAIDGLFDAGVGEEYLSDLVRTSQESSIQTRMLKDSLVTDLREMLQNLVDTQVRESLKLAETLSGSYRDSGTMLAGQISQSIESSFREPLEKIAQSVSAASGDQSKVVGSMLQEVLVAFMAKLESTFGQQFQGLSSMLEQSVTAMQQMQNGFAALVSDLRDASESSSQAVSQQLSKTLQDMHNSQDVMQAALNDMVGTMQSAVESMGTQGVEAGGKIAVQLEKMFADGEVRQQKMTDQMDAFVQHMQDSVGRGQTDTMDQIAGTVSQLEQQMQTMVNGIGASVSRAQEDSLRNVSNASDAMSARLEDMLSSFDRGRHDMDQQSQQALAQFREEAKSALDGLGSQVKSLLELVERERHAMRQTIDTLGGQTERSLQGMQLGADKMRVAAERFDTAGASVQTAMQSSGDAISALRSGSSEISVAMRELSTVVSDYRANRDVTAQNLQSLQLLVDRAQQEAGVREKTVSDLIRLSDQIHDMNLETEEYLSKISEVVSHSFDEFGRGVERTLLKTMGSLDAELDKAVKSLAGGVETVAENIEDLSDVLAKANTRTVRS